jgi:hypothetical protein
MNRLRVLKNWQVKHTTTGRVRFSLGANTHWMLCELLKAMSEDQAPATLGDLSDVYLEAGRRLAQELVVRRPFLMLLDGDNRFQLTRSEATLLLGILWVEVGGGNGGLVSLFGDLHQLLS